MTDTLLLSQDFPPDVGGAQTYALEVARGLARRGRVRAVAPRRPDCRALDEALPFEVRRIAGGHNRFAMAALPEVLRAARDGFGRVFAVQWTGALPALLAGGLPVHVAAHGRELLFNPLPPGIDGTYSALRRWVFRRVERVFPVSRFTAGLLRDLGVPDGRIRVVGNGADPDRFRPLDRFAARRRFGWGSGPVVLSVCRLVPRKGVDTVLRAMHEVQTLVPGTLLVVAGDGPERGALERLAAEVGVARQVRFLGSVPYETLPELFAASDAFVLVPREARPDVEGFGLVYLEAGACGLPVIGSRTGGIPDAVNDGATGLLVPPDDPPAVAAALHFLLADPLAGRAMGEAGRRHVLEWGTWERVVDLLESGMSGG